jgi:hypothetical protein
MLLTRLLLLIWLLGSLALTEPAATADCNNFKLIPSAKVPYAYTFISNVSRNRTQIPAACQSIHPDAQMAVVRNLESVVYLQQLVYNFSQLGNYSQVCSWIGLDQTSKVDEPFGNWVWTDGKTCNNSDPTDVRCYKRLSFNDIGNSEDCGVLCAIPYPRTTFTDYPCNSTNRYYCETPGMLFNLVLLFILNCP